MRSSTRLVAGLVVLALLIGGTVTGGYLLTRPSGGSEADSIPRLEYYATDMVVLTVNTVVTSL